MFFVFSHKQRKESFNLKRRLAGIFQSPTQTETSESSLLKDSSFDSESHFKSKLPKVEGFTQWLQHTGFDISPILFVGMSIIIGLIIFIIFAFILNADLLFSVLFGVASSFVVPWVVISYLNYKQKKKFLEEFPIALDMIQRALRAGHSSEKAIEMVATRITGPIGKVFQQLSEKMSLGEAPEVALAQIANRVGIDEFRLLSIVLILQRETGGSLAESVENFSKMLRTSQNLRKKIKALTGEVRATAIILTSIPFGIGGLIYLTSPHYLDSLFYTTTGHTLLLIAGGMLSTGMAIIFRMAYKEIY